MIDLVEIHSLSQVLCQEIIDLVLHILHNPHCSFSDHVHNEGNTHKNKAAHCKETINMVCTPIPSEDSDLFKLPPNGTRAFVVRIKRFKGEGNPDNYYVSYERS